MQRLKTRPQFQAVLAGGIVARTSHFALHRLALVPAGVVVHAVDKSVEKVGEESAAPAFAPLFTHTDHTWLGAMVPKRWAKRAVTRNAIKRQIYTIGGAAESMLPQAAYVVRLKSGFDRKQFVSASSDALKAAVRAEVQLLLARIDRDSRP
ncbi:ribonuclease P protein component [Xylophilus sp. GOD-11R]|uniref:ribonuclease P protein component n=1 Tax=Xylophilus sp. GOD-11R TaxID=3089814 RepID=UPI00298D11B8|nr:ribonuclease P protein component [Xylophilus sp. GOD-11R]WPB57045.1 ribonuclease P protein component [Xylophilus sp. GOD-11R]